MDWNLKKMWQPAATSLVAVTSLLSADDMQKNRSMENANTAAQKNNNQMWTETINPSARPGVREGGWDVFVTGQALYWKPNETGLTFAIQNDCDGCTNYANDATVLESRAKYSWGFNVGIGYNMQYDNWDLALNWTHFDTNKDFECCCNECDECDECEDECNECEPCERECGECNECVSSCNPCETFECNECPPCTPCCCDKNTLACCENIMFPTNVNFTQPCIPCGMWSCDAFSKWSLKLDMLDLMLGSSFYARRHVALKPSFGLRAVEIRQTLTSIYNGALSPATCACCPCPGSNSLNTELFQDRVKDRQKYKAIGPRAGLDSLWTFGNSGLGMYGNLGLSLVYGREKIRHQEEFIFDEFPDNPCEECDECCCVCECECEVTCPAVDIQSGRHSKCGSSWKSRAITDIAIGLTWDRQFYNDQYHLGLNVGWEHHMFFNMNQFLRFAGKGEQGAIFTNGGNLAVEGLTFGARIDF